MRVLLPEMARALNTRRIRLATPTKEKRFRI